MMIEFFSLKLNGAGEQDPIGIVNIGWNLNIQKLFEKKFHDDKKILISG